MKDLITKINAIKRTECSESGNRRMLVKVCGLVNASDLSKEDKQIIVDAACYEANPSGWYYTTSGQDAAIKAIKALEEYESQPDEAA